MTVTPYSNDSVALHARIKQLEDHIKSQDNEIEILSDELSKPKLQSCGNKKDFEQMLFDVINSHYGWIRYRPYQSIWYEYKTSIDNSEIKIIIYLWWIEIWSQDRQIYNHRSLFVKRINNMLKHVKKCSIRNENIEHVKQLEDTYNLFVDDEELKEAVNFLTTKEGKEFNMIGTDKRVPNKQEEKLLERKLNVEVAKI